MINPILCIRIKYYNKIGFSGKINLFFSLLIILGDRINSDNSLALFYSENVFQSRSFKKKQFFSKYIFSIYKYKLTMNLGFIPKIIEL